MAEPITVDNGALTDYAVLVDDVTDGTLGTGAKQLVGLVDATIGSTTKIASGGGVEATALRVTVASDSTGVLSVDDNGSSLTVDAPVGTPVAARLSDGTAFLTTTGGRLSVDGSGVTQPISGTVDTELTTADLDTGAGTDTRAVVGLVRAESGGGALVGSANPLPVVVQTALPAGTANIGDVDVLSLPAIPAGTNNIGDVDVLTLPALPAGSNNIGDVDVLSVVPGTGATALGKAVDSVAGATDTGVADLAVRDDALATLTPADGDYTNLRTNNRGALWIVPDGTVTVAVSGAVDTELPAAAALADNTANPTVPGVGAFLMGYDGTNWDRVRADGGALFIQDGGNVITVDGTVIVTATDLDIRNLDVAQDDVRVGGMAANDAAVADNPVATGGRASDAVPTAVSADGDAVWAWRDRRGAAKTVMVDDAGDSVMDGANNAIRVNMVAGGGSGGTSSTDESAYTPAASVGTPIMGAADETSPDAAAEGTLAIARVTLNRALHVNLRDASGNELAVGGGTQYDEDTAKAAAEKITMAGVIRADTPASQVDTDGDRTELLVDATGRLWTHDDVLDAALAGSELQVDVVAALPAGTNNIGDVDVLTMPTVTVQATDLDIRNLVAADVVTVEQGTAANLNARVQGPVAHDAVIGSSNPGMDGGIASAAAPADVSADGDAVRAWHLRNGAKVVSLSAAGTLIPAGGGTEATALRVTVASDSTGVLSIDDNAASITVDATDLDIRNLDVAQDDVRVGGMAAIDAAVADNPVLMGGRASTAQPSDVSADGDAQALWVDQKGSIVPVAAPHVGLLGEPWSLVHEAARYTTTQTSTVLVTGGASEKIVVTKVQIQAGGTTAGELQLYFGTGAFSRGTSRAIFDGEFAPSATLKPGVIMDGPFIAGTNGDDLMVTTSAAINPLTINVWYYVVT